MSAPETTVQAPTKVCPNCRAQAQTFDKRCPHCGKKYKRRRMLRFFVAATAAGIAVIVLIVVLLSAGANSVQNDSDKHAITQHQYRLIHTGMTRGEVKAIIGDVKPASDNDVSIDASQFGGTTNSGELCRYYNLKGHLLTIFQLCFDHDTHRLTSKASA